METVLQAITYFPESSVIVHRMMAVPVAFAETVAEVESVLETETISALSVENFTAIFSTEISLGKDSVRIAVCPVVSSVLSADRVAVSDCFSFGFTVTVQVAVSPDGEAVAVMVAVPSARAVSFPVASTMAMLGFEEI